jgi:hypothetical protein
LKNFVNFIFFVVNRSVNKAMRVRIQPSYTLFGDKYRGAIQGNRK